MFLEMYLKIIVTIIVKFETSKSLANKLIYQNFRVQNLLNRRICLEGFQFRWLKIKGLEAAFHISIIVDF